MSRDAFPKADTILIEDNTRVRHFHVDQNFDGWRLDVFLADRIGSISRTFAAQIAEQGDVAIDSDRTVKKGLRLQQGEIVTVREHLQPERVQDPQVDVLYEDELLLIVNKPAGMLSHQVGSTRLNTVNAFLERRGYSEARIAHRLDRETSGAVICGKTGEVVGAVQKAFQECEVEKHYRALAVDPGRVWEPGAASTIDIPLGDDRSSTLPMKRGRGSQTAVTHVEVRGRRKARPERPPLADLKLALETGRQHQIRAHLSLVGTPIAGDKLYNHSDRFFRAITDEPERSDLAERLIFDRQALHAHRIGMRHPKSADYVSAKAPFPELPFIRLQGT